MSDFEKASDIHDENTEPCRDPKCPFKGRIQKSSYEWFCSECMIFRAIDTDKYLQPHRDTKVE